MALLSKTKNKLEQIHTDLPPFPTRKALTLQIDLIEKMYDLIQNTPECSGDFENVETKRLDQCINELSEMIDDFQVELLKDE